MTPQGNVPSSVPGDPVREVGLRAREEAVALRTMSTTRKNRDLRGRAKAILARRAEIESANREDLAADLLDAKKDRLRISEKKVVAAPWSAENGRAKTTRSSGRRRETPMRSRPEGRARKKAESEWTARRALRQLILPMILGVLATKEALFGLVQKSGFW